MVNCSVRFHGIFSLMSPIACGLLLLIADVMLNFLFSGCGITSALYVYTSPIACDLHFTLSNELQLLSNIIFIKIIIINNTN